MERQNVALTKVNKIFKLLERLVDGWLFKDVGLIVIIAFALEPIYQRFLGVALLQAKLRHEQFFKILQWRRIH